MRTNREYYLQHNRYVEHQGVKMCCDTNQFPELKFLGPHKKPHGVHGLVKNYHIHFDTKLGDVTYKIRCISFASTL